MNSNQCWRLYSLKQCTVDWRYTRNLHNLNILESLKFEG